MYQEGGEKKNYQEEILKAFQKIFLKNQDPYEALAISKKKPQQDDLTEEENNDLLSKEEILFMQYPMEKKGKNFKTTEVRTFKIDDGKILQIDKNGGEKQLPLPQKLTLYEREEEPKDDWNKSYLDYDFKIELQFSSRTPITVYFKKKENAKEIYLFLTGTLKENRVTMQKAGDKYNHKIMNCFLKKFTKIRQTKNYMGIEKKKSKVIKRLKELYSKPNLVKDMVYEWEKKSHSFNQIMDVSIQLFYLFSEEDLRGGKMKLWVGNKTHEKYIFCEEFLQNQKIQQVYETKFTKPNKFCLDGIESRTILQFQLEIVIVKANQKETHIWRSERFFLHDLLRSKSKARKGLITLYSSHHRSQLCLQVLNLNKLSFNEYVIPQICPTEFPIIRELYGNVEIQKLDENIMENYSLAVQHYLEYESGVSISFCCFRKFFDLLSIDTLIEKIYKAFPFNQYLEKPQKGTFFYSTLVKKGEKFSYYDADKLIWKFHNPQMKRFLSAFKSFDETPRINFTDPFYHICKKCLQIAMNESQIKWRSQLFSKSLEGRESMAFFLVLGLLRVGSSLFLQQQKKTVASNSLLFHYVLKKQLPKIYYKILKTELNIEAFFGVESTSLFSGCLSHELFNTVVELFIEENKENQPIHHSLIGVMLSIICLIDDYKTAYLGPEHYTNFFKHFCSSILEYKLVQFIKLAKKFQQISKKYGEEGNFKVMKECLEHFHSENSYNGELGQITQQLYDEFMSYRYKREADIRKIFMVIDIVELGIETGSISLSLHQNHQKIYEHQFNGVGLDELRHPIDFKLLRLDKITIIVSCKSVNKMASYRCQLDPKAFPSNYYFQFVQELVPIKLELHSKRYLGFQVYIKDSCEIEYLQNSIPDKYISNFLLSEVNFQNQFSNPLLKEDILFCNSYIKNFRMRENNLNLLYGKLGWYGNHYLIPQERTIQIFKEQGPRILELDDEDERRLATLRLYNRCLFGKSILPINNIKGQKTTKFHTQVYKSKMMTCHQTGKNEIREYLQYTSVNNLLSYCLDNFYIPSDINFLSFYYKINKQLPLLSYLGYQTLQFYVMPTICVIVFHENKNCRVKFSDEGTMLNCKYTQQKRKDLEEWANHSFILPQSLEFAYCYEPMYADEFLYLLKLNILEHCYENRVKEKKGNSPKKGGSPKKGIEYSTTLVGKNLDIPNFLHYNLYCILNETDIGLELQFSKCSFDRLAKISSYQSFAYINGKWKKCAIFVKLESPNHLYYYIEETQTRKKYVVKNTDFIEYKPQKKSKIDFGEDKNVETVKFTDKELEQMKECVLSELIKFG